MSYKIREVSCAWCHRLNPIETRFCPECGHRADRCRMQCDCPQCRPPQPEPSHPANALTAPYELVTGSPPYYHDQKSVGRFPDRQEAIHRALCVLDTEDRQAFVFEWVTPKTRLLVFHTLDSLTYQTRGRLAA